MKGFILLVSALWTMTAAADPSTSSVEEKLRDSLPKIQVDEIQEIAGGELYQVRVGARIYYTTPDAAVLIQGFVVDLETKENLTRRAMAEAREAVFDELPASSFVVYQAPNERHRITVFTDLTCPYCAQLHHSIPALNANGVTVRYALFPREGYGSAAWIKGATAWCADNRKDVIEAAFARFELPDVPACDTSGMMQLHRLARDLGIQGTPTIFLDNGQKIDGYAETTEILQKLGV